MPPHKTNLVERMSVAQEYKLLKMIIESEIEKSQSSSSDLF